MLTNPVVDFVYFDAGGGHRSAALALQSVIASCRPEWQVRLVNLQEVLDSLDIFRKVTGLRLEDLYNHALAKGWTLGSPLLLTMMHAVIRLYHPAQVKVLKEYWRLQQPDMVVSLVPNFNRALFESMGQIPLVTIMTDLADYPPHFWIERQNQFVICGTDRAIEQAHQAGYTTDRAIRTSGMILRPQFYEAAPIDRVAERVSLGLDPNLPTGLVLFGGEGSNIMAAIAERLGNCPLNLQLIMICGKNQTILKKIERLKTRNRILVEGFTKRVPYFMQLSDFFIGKPGPGSISEALKMNLPVIVERNAWTLPQERYNTDWVAEQGVGVVLKNFKQIEAAIGELLTTGNLQKMQSRIGRLANRAVYEIPPILEQILKETPAMSGAGSAG